MFATRSKLCITLAGLSAFVACKPPTQFEVVMTANIDCEKLKGVALVAGAPGEVDTKDPATVNTFCDQPGGKGTEAALGTVVIIPSGDREAKVSVRLVAGVGEKAAETCIEGLQGGETASTIESCVVARRSIAFLPSRPFTLPIGLWSACVGKVCGDGLTCVDGKCITDEVDAEQCLSSDGCGDAILYSLNEGGGGAGGGSGGGAPRTVFVTSVGPRPGALGGLAGADKLCQSLATDAGLSGTFLAWLSTDKESPSTRFTKSGPGWALVDGTMVAESWADLTDGSLLHAIDKTEKNEAPTLLTSCSITPTAVVVTQTTTKGEFAFAGEADPTLPKFDCNDWTGTSVNEGMNDRIEDGIATRSDASWTADPSCNSTGFFCAASEAHLYCFQQ
jgi:hypothetical protein